MIEFIHKHWKMIINVVLLILLPVSLFFVIKLSFIYAAPLYFALMFYLLYRPLLLFLNKKGVSYKIAATISISTITIAILAFFTSFGTLLFFQAQGIYQNFPTWFSWFQNSIEAYVDTAKNQFEQVPNSVSENIIEQLQSQLDKAGELVYSFGSFLFSNISSFSSLILKLLLGYILSIFLTLEWPKISTYFSKFISNKFKDFSITVFGDTAKGIISFLKAQMILISCTFAFVFVSLSFFGVENALLLAFISAILDLLPLLGIPILFFPWIAYLFFVGNTALAIKLTIVYIVIFVFRQIMEPRITGNSLGISPFLMFSGMIVSAAVFGVIGILVAPVLLIIIKSMVEKGYISTLLSTKKE